MKNHYYTYDEANGTANMRQRTLGGCWYVKRHYRVSGGERVGFWYSIHQRRAAK